jgi:DNA-binding IclR family transcriptional regulator
LLAYADDAARFGLDARELEQVRRQGWAASVAEREQGVASVSAPVLDSAGVLHGVVGVSGPVERLGRQPGQQLSVPVVAAARELERRAGLRAS